MSDSESDLLPSSVFTFQNENTTVCAKGPNMNSANVTNLSFRNNVMTSTMQMSRNFGRNHYPEPSFDQRSMYYRRETSPMSLYGGSDMRGRNQSYYHAGMSSQRSMYNGRSGSPMSMRSMDSNASVSAVDIALAFKNVKFNKYDLRMIKEAYNKFMKRRIRKKIEKRRNMRLFLNGYRRKSGYDSGEHGSDSSISSSDDCKSTTSAMYKDNMSSCRSTRTDLTDFRKRIQESNMYKDCTENFKQNAMKNMFSKPPANFRDRYHASKPLPTPPVQNQQPFTQKDRFKNGFLLPSQRFNKSVASVPIPERERLQGNQNTLNYINRTHSNCRNAQERANIETDSDQEEIFSNVTVREKSTHNFAPHINGHEKYTDPCKRSLELEDCSNKKRPKLSSPVKQQKANGIISSKGASAKKANTKAIKDNNGISKDIMAQNNNEPKDIKNSNTDFEFIKPQLPVRKSGPGKTKEKLISKSAPPLIDSILPQAITQVDTETVPATKTSVNEENQASEEKQITADEPPDTTQNSTTDLSMRPSFIKRKLFSQKLDVTEKKNISQDAINVNSPQTNVYSAIQKEKHKARKLVSNQSCLSRDVVKEDNNLLDLIHKIVPPDRMNVTNVTNKTSVSTNVSSKNNQVDDDDKWDVTSVISTVYNDDVSDTYTDEEIFAVDENKQKTRNEKVVKNNVNLKKVNDCKILVEKLPKNVMIATKPLVEMNKTVAAKENNDGPKKSVYSCVKSFWDTDFESDVENSMPKRWTSAVKENQIVAKENYCIAKEANKTIKNKNTQLNVSLATVSESIKSKTMPTNNMGKLKLNVTKNLSIKSFLTPKHKKSKVNNQKLDKVDQQKEDKRQNLIKVDPHIDNLSKPYTDPEINHKQPSKQIPSKSKKNETISKNVEGKKPKKADSNKKTPSPKNNKKTQSPSKTKPSKKITQSLNNNGKVTKSAKKTKNIDKSIQSANKPKNNDKPSESPKENKNKIPKSQNTANKTLANRSMSSRSVRTPKRKACCDALEHESQYKPAIKSNENPNKKPKLTEYSSVKGKAAKKNSSPKESSRKNNKKGEPKVDIPIVYESEASNRTLRSRRIDLSSSINSSTENLTTLKLRNLRTRRVDLSSSLKNSSLDESVTIIKNSRSKPHAKKVGTKPGFAESLDKRQRR